MLLASALGPCSKNYKNNVWVYIVASPGSCCTPCFPVRLSLSLALSSRLRIWQGAPDTALLAPKHWLQAQRFGWNTGISLLLHWPSFPLSPSNQKLLLADCCIALGSLPIGFRLSPRPLSPSMVKNNFVQLQEQAEVMERPEEERPEEEQAKVAFMVRWLL